MPHACNPPTTLLATTSLLRRRTAGATHVSRPTALHGGTASVPPESLVDVLGQGHGQGQFAWLSHALHDTSTGLPTVVTPEERSLQARIAAHSLHAKVIDPTAHTAPARPAFLDRFERQVDPDGLLSNEERHRRAEHARKAYFLNLARKSARARRKR
jgi:hypothetical protein